MEFYSPRQVTPNSVEDLIQFIQDNVRQDLRLCDTQGLVEKLMGLQHNPENILERIAASLLKADLDPGSNIYGKNSFVLYRDSNIMLRLVVWEPRASENFTERDEELFAYGVCHDHDFELMSLGLKGSGYITHMYQYQHKGSDYIEDEHIDIDFLGDFTLEQGSVLYMDKSKDIHSQSPPADVSMSLNIIMEHDKKQKQIFVDPQSSRIVEFRGALDRKSYIHKLHQELIK